MPLDFLYEEIWISQLFGIRKHFTLLMTNSQFTTSTLEMINIRPERIEYFDTSNLKTLIEIFLMKFKESMTFPLSH